MWDQFSGKLLDMELLIFMWARTIAISIGQRSTHLQFMLHMMFIQIYVKYGLEETDKIMRMRKKSKDKLIFFEMEILEQNGSPEISEVRDVVVQKLSEMQEKNETSEDVQETVDSSNKEVLKNFLRQKTLESLENQKKNHTNFLYKNIVPLLTASAQNGQWFATLDDSTNTGAYNYISQNFNNFHEICLSKGLQLTVSRFVFKISWE